MEPGADENAGRLEFAGPGKLVTTDAGTYWFTKHALDQMKIRKLSEGEVLATIEKPDAVVPHPQENRKRSRCYRGNMKAVDVITESRPDRTIVVTAMKRQLNRNERPQL